MKKLNDYLYSGDTVLKILQIYAEDLKQSAKEKDNQIDLLHCNVLLQIAELLQHNEFLTSQSQRIREFYKLMANDYPFLAFAFKGRIKSLIRAEAKFYGYIVEYIYDYYIEHGKYPSLPELKSNLNCFRDLIAYRIVISLPKCHLKEGEICTAEENKYLYDIANKLLGFLEERGFTAEPASFTGKNKSLLLQASVSPYYRDYVANPDVRMPVIAKHLKNIYDEEELDHQATISEKETDQIECSRKVTRYINFYNLDAIIAFGYRQS